MEQLLIPWCTCGMVTVSYGATTTSSGIHFALGLPSCNVITLVLIDFFLRHRINLPKRKRRDRLKDLERASPRESFIETDVETASEASSEQDYSYEFAQMEVIMKTLGNNGIK